MKYGRIPGVDKKLSRLVQGTIMCQTDQQDFTNELLDAVFEQGINTFDTAHGYGNGECERSVGEWINSRGIRDEVVILGKGAHPNRDVPHRVTPYYISADINDSLHRFKTDYIDLYILHRDDPSVPVGPIVECLHEHKEKGRIHAYGGSNWSAARVAEANTYAKEHGLTPFVASSPNLSLATQLKEPWSGCVSVSGPDGKADREWYAQNDVTLFTWSSLAGGFFSGRFTPDNLDSFETYLDKLCVEVYCYGDNWGRLDRANQMAEEKGVSLAQIALGYVMNQPQDIYALIAVYNANEAADSAKAIELELTVDEINWLENGAQ
ncbi:MAG: aldo/keto reductase [Chloroflexota bacterium]